MDANMKYAGFWKRFAAGWVDFFVLLLPLLFVLWFESVSRTLAFLSLPFLFLFNGYDIYFLGRWGQTIGKKSQGIKVVSLDGTPITWKKAFLRSSVNVGLGILSTISTLVALSSLTEADFSSLSWADLAVKKAELSPYINELTVATNVWVWSEVVVLLLNRKRRALHDFIAGTVVVESLQPIGEIGPDRTEARPSAPD